ncbi:hypothetical protein ACFTXM_44890 [Streptomyces sp. NPDC056930]|uniref:hypothetical protein n=1 Tax=Streptomyces sp. NPDC056930 TaxID=3345967 RepID=UPI00362CEB81
MNFAPLRPREESERSAGLESVMLTAHGNRRRRGYSGTGRATRGTEAMAEPCRHVRRAATLVHHVVTAAYEKAIPFPAKGGQHPLESLVVDSAAVLQHLRFTVDLLLIEGIGSATGRCT